MRRALIASAPVALVLAGLGASLAAGASPPRVSSAKAAPLRLPDMPLHDPWIVADKASGTYYLYTSNIAKMSGDPRLGIMVYTSRDLAHWTRPRVVFALPKDSWANEGAWAPEVHRWKGRWYLFATFYNDAKTLPVTRDGSGVERHPVRRSTLLASADSLSGPFSLRNDGTPLVDPSTMTLDGTLYVDPKGKPWLVYAHEWVQVGDGTIEAMPLSDRLTSAGPSRVLFHASSGPWVKRPDAGQPGVYVTDGPELFQTRTGRLLMLWSSYDPNGYVQGLARSTTGQIEGPWEQLPRWYGRTAATACCSAASTAR
ncbi:glycoside hydrolase family 43 protein [Novosphingobium sp. 9]|uniref:glycoside hydrolase family 43 protein n=1 Tax=Novosphingobium sp. 9 TaxID=2025349 RepID=UPI0021B55FF1|nr:glycoside hydrolase family 43 protein [Novosphingobium sp. 9]